MKKDAVVVIDDEHLIRTIITGVASQEGFISLAFSEPEEVEALLHTSLFSRVAVAFIDVKLTCNPEKKEGVEVSAMLKQTHPDIPVIGMSGYHKNSKAMLSVGADAFLPKPFDLAEIRQILSVIRASEVCGHLSHLLSPSS